MVCMRNSDSSHSRTRIASWNCTIQTCTRRTALAECRVLTATICPPSTPMTIKVSRPLFEADPDVAAAIDNETRRQHEGLELIASENFVSEAVLEATGSVFTNKYAEGY